jgi:hypothetical protein
VPANPLKDLILLPTLKPCIALKAPRRLRGLRWPKAQLEEQIQLLRLVARRKVPQQPLRQLRVLRQLGGWALPLLKVHLASAYRWL